MIPNILRQSAAMDGLTGELFQHHREETAFKWSARRLRESDLPPSRAWLEHATTVPIRTVAVIPKNHFALSPAVPPPSLFIDGDKTEFRAALRRLGILKWTAPHVKERYGETWSIYSACFPWHNWQARFARVHRDYRPAGPWHPYARYLQACFKYLRHPPAGIEWQGEVLSHRDWHYATRKSVADHWKRWAHANGFTWADFSRKWKTGKSERREKICRGCWRPKPISEFSQNGKPSRRTICRRCDTAARKDRRARRKEETTWNQIQRTSKLLLKSGSVCLNSSAAQAPEPVDHGMPFFNP